MSADLIDLAEFLHHGNTQIRQIAVENLLGYSTTQPSLFKLNKLKPVQDLKLLVKDYPPIAKNALTILINLSNDSEVRNSLALDDSFLELLLLRITNIKEPNADEITMLLANLAKADKMLRLMELKRTMPKTLSNSPFAMDQLLDCFVKGAEGSYNKSANFDYLSYLFADLAKFPVFRSYFITPQPNDSNIIPLTKLIVFTEHKSVIRRRGVASTIKNVAFEVSAHHKLLSTSGPDAINVLPYILLPLMGSEDYSDEDTEGMLEVLQYLPSDKHREEDVQILKTHLETLLLLTTTREGRDILRKVRVYPIVRECHEQINDETVREACDRLVQVIMRNEEEQETESLDSLVNAPKVQKSTQEAEQEQEQDEDEDEDNQIIDVF